MAKDVYYFSHDVNASNDPKIVAMESEFGVISYAWWIFKNYTFFDLDIELLIFKEK